MTAEATKSNPSIEAVQVSASAGVSAEQMFMSAKRDTPSSIYFELAGLVADRVAFRPTFTEDLDQLISDGDASKATAEARATLAYRIGARAAFADFAAGNDTELQKLMGYYVTEE